MVMTYALIYQETVVMLIPFFPIGMILFIFYNYYYEVQFKRPKITVIRNMKLIQAIMSATGDVFEVQYYIIEQCFYWQNKQKTLLMLNILLLSFFLAIPLLFIPLRYFLVLGLWGTVSLSSPFCVALRQGLVQIVLEYGIVMERVMPVYMNSFHAKMETVYIPRIVWVLSWVPIVNRYLPTQGRSDAPSNKNNTQ